MALTTYDELKTAIQDWCPRGDISPKVDEFIDLAESVFKRPPKPVATKQMGGIRVNKTRTTGTLTSGTSTLALPSDFLEFDRFILTADYSTLVPVNADHLGVKKLSGSGKPTYVCVQDVFEFDVAPDDSYAYELSYWPSVSALSDSNTSNFLLTNFPDVYLSACLYWAWSWARDTQEMAKWAGAYSEAASLANQSYARRLSQGSISMQNSGSTP